MKQHPSLVLLLLCITGFTFQSCLKQNENIDNRITVNSIQDSPQFGGKLILSTSSDPKSFNPIIAKETSTTTITNYIFEGLTTVDAVTTEVKPHLAEKWETSEDGLIWTFHLKKDVKWNDGEPFTADDVLFTFNELIFNPEIPNSAADIFKIDGKKFDVEKIDDFAVRFILPSKFAPFLLSMTQEILPKHIFKKNIDNASFIQALGVNTKFENVVGTGPFKLAGYEPGQKIELQRNPLYWKKNPEGKTLPYLDAIIYKIIKNTDTALLQFQNKELDMYDVRGIDYPILKAKENEGNFTIHNLGPTFTSNFLAFNMNPITINGKSVIEEKKRAIFEKKEFRQAVSYAIDRESIADIVLNGFGKPQWGPSTESSGFYHNPNVQTYPFDPEKAKLLLKNLGYEDRDSDSFLEDEEGKDLEFTLSTNSDNDERVKIGEMIRKDLENIGIKIYFSPLDFNNLVTKLTATFDWEIIIIGLTGGIEPHFGQNVWHSSGGLHVWHPNQKSPSREWEKRIDKIFTEGVQELDTSKRKTLYDEWQIIASTELPLIYTVVSEQQVATRNHIENLRPTSYGGVLWNIEEMYVK